jgi:glycosyltransferase involved in cell wall biosynthesis
MRLTIITINLNNAIGLAETINSVIGQTFNDHEYIIIDGGSTDDSNEVINKYKDKFAYWISEKDKGIYNAMNKGILKAKGDYLLFLNSGDTLIDGTVLSKVFSNSPVCDFINCNLNYFDGTRYIKTVKLPANLTFRFLAFGPGLQHPSLFIKRKVFDEVGLYNENNKIVSDWELNLIAIAKHNLSYQHLDITVTNFQVGGISSARNDLAIAERITCIKKHFNIFWDDYIFLNRLHSIRIFQLIKKYILKSSIFLFF